MILSKQLKVATQTILFVLLLTASALAQTTTQESQPVQQPAAPPVASTDPGARKARELLDKMVKALGGQAYLTMQDMQQSGRTYGFSKGEPAGVGTLYWSFWKWPDKDRIELTKKRDVVYVNNGDNGYEITFRGTTWEEQKDLEDFLRRRHHSTQQVLREWLNQPGTALFYDGPAAAERKPSEKVTVMNAQNEAVSFYLDINTFLPIKKTFVWRDPKTKDRTEESEIYDNYRLVQGIMTPFSLTRSKDDWRVSQRFIFDVKYNQNIPDSLFEAKVGDNAKPQPKGR